jgi:hypothetical protein
MGFLKHAVNRGVSRVAEPPPTAADFFVKTSAAAADEWKFFKIF